MITDLIIPFVGPDWAGTLAGLSWVLVALVAIWIVWRLYLALAGSMYLMSGRGKAARLSVIDATAVDQKRRIVLVRRDGVEHLIMIGGPNDLVIEQGIGLAQSAQTAARQTATQTPQAVKAPKISEPIDDIDTMDDDIFESLINDKEIAAKPVQTQPASPPRPVARTTTPPAASMTPPTPRPTPQMAQRPAPLQEMRPEPRAVEPASQTRAVEPASQARAQQPSQSVATPPMRPQQAAPLRQPVAAPSNTISSNTISGMQNPRQEPKAPEVPEPQASPPLKSLEDEMDALLRDLKPN